MQTQQCAATAKIVRGATVSVRVEGGSSDESTPSSLSSSGINEQRYFSLDELREESELAASAARALGPGRAGLNVTGRALAGNRALSRRARNTLYSFGNNSHSKW
jgi:hypothetical protein